MRTKSIDVAAALVVVVAAYCYSMIDSRMIQFQLEHTLEDTVITIM